jgi:hypothetical protein
MTGKNVYNPEMSGGWEKAMGVTDKLGKVANAGGMAVLGAMTGGAAPAILGGLGKAVGSVLPSDQPQVDPNAMQDLVPPSPIDVTGASISKYGGKIYGKKGKRYFALGGEINPVPNAYTTNRSMKPLIINGENTGRFVPQLDKLPFQDSGYWGKNLQGINVPPPLPLNTTGNVDFNAINQQSILPLNPPPLQRRNGGSLLTEYQGFKHEQGGVPISNSDEVEDGENSFNTKDGNKYIFSDSIIIPGAKKTFAQGGKRIASINFVKVIEWLRKHNN